MPHPFGYVRVSCDRRTRWNLWLTVMADLTDIPGVDIVEVT
jgi:hypothetical protein